MGRYIAGFSGEARKYGAVSGLNRRPQPANPGIHIALRDAAAEKHGLLRIVDESGEDYLYPKKSFRPIALPQAVKRAVLAA
jgi:hypothetical protein